MTLLVIFTLACFGAALAVPALVAAAPGGTAPNELQAELERMVHLDGAPGVAVRVYRDGKLLYAAGAGEAFQDRAVPVASASKWVAAALVLTLIDEGRLSLDEPIGRRLPEFQGAAGLITLRQLLSYTSGHESLTEAVDIWQPADITLRESARAIAARPLEGTPGQAFRYGGPGLQVAGALAEQATGQSWEELFQERLARPLGMTRSRWTHPMAARQGVTNIRNPNLQGGLITTAEDYGRFLTMLADQGRFQGRRILSPRAVDLLATPQTAGLPMAFKPPGVTGALQYNLGSWCEDPRPDGPCRRLSSPGALGTYPWLDRETGLYGIFVTRRRLPLVVDRIQTARRIIVADALARAP